MILPTSISGCYNDDKCTQNICSVKMSGFRGKSIFPYLLINYINIIQAVDTNKEVLGFSQPSQCKNNEYFDTVSFTCVECDANKNLRPSVDREFHIIFT